MNNEFDELKSQYQEELNKEDSCVESIRLSNRIKLVYEYKEFKTLTKNLDIVVYSMTWIIFVVNLLYKKVFNKSFLYSFDNDLYLGKPTKKEIDLYESKNVLEEDNKEEDEYEPFIDTSYWKLDDIKIEKSLRKNQGRIFRHSIINGRDFSNMDMVESEFNHSVIRKCKFNGSNLSKSNLRNATLSDCDFTNTNLDGCDFSYATLRNCILKGANLENTIMVSCSQY